ncbi:LCP family protein [Corynebacterium mendelii]|uniref:LCP family protein n=1 Tax=Corynebacterium mendelii TaxID=2765362 RepID=UPI00362A3CCF
MASPSRPVRDIHAAPVPANPAAQSGPRFVRILVAVLAVMVLAVSGAGWATVGRISEDIKSDSALHLGEEIAGGGGAMKAPVHGEAADGATDILLVGSDSRADAQGNPLTPEEIAMLRAGDEQNDNTDTIMVIRVPNDGSSATAISIPRDTYIHDPKMGNLKINGVYSSYKAAKATQLVEQGVTDQQTIDEKSTEAGRAALIRAISRLTGVTVDHYAEIGLLGFVLLTDAVGGVDVCLNNAVYDEFSQADFPAGVQTLGGPDALSFVRQRHGLPRGDLDRITRQQAFMASLVNKVLSNGTLSSPAKLSSLADAVRRSVIIDQGWDIMGFANQLQNLAGGKVKFATIPVTSIDGVGDYGESVVTVSVPEIHAFFKTLLGSQSPSPSPTAPTTTEAPRKTLEVHTLNATTTSGLAGRVAGAVKNMGYPIGEIGNAPDGLYTYSQVLADDTTDPDVIALAKDLGGLPVEQAQSLEPGEAVIAVADDYTGPKSDEPLSADGTTGTGTPSVIGQPGEAPAPPTTPVIDGGGNGPRCVN